MAVSFTTISLEHDQVEPKKELLIFGYGENKSTKGVFLFDDQSIENVMGIFQNRGVRMMFDYCHMSMLENPTSPIEANTAAGWFDLKIGDNKELFATNIEWTPKALGLIKNKEYLYISPCFLVNDENKVQELFNVAIVNNPGTLNAESLIELSVNDIIKRREKMTTKEKQVSANDDQKELVSKIVELEAQLSSIVAENNDLKSVVQEAENTKKLNVVDNLVKEGRIPLSLKSYAEKTLMRSEEDFNDFLGGLPEAKQVALPKTISNSNKAVPTAMTHPKSSNNLGLLSHLPKKEVAYVSKLIKQGHTTPEKYLADREIAVQKLSNPHGEEE